MLIKTPGTIPKRISAWIWLWFARVNMWVTNTWAKLLENKLISNSFELRMENQWGGSFLSISEASGIHWFLLPLSSFIFLLQNNASKPLLRVILQNPKRLHFFFVCLKKWTYASHYCLLHPHVPASAGVTVTNNFTSNTSWRSKMALLTA